MDVVINHMTGGYSGTGTAGDHFDGGNCNYPGVPYGHSDCNNKGPINDYHNRTNVRDGDLVGLRGKYKLNKMPIAFMDGFVDDFEE